MSIRSDIGSILNDANVADGGVWFGKVTDQEVAGPFCIFHLEAGVEQWAMGTGGIDNSVWVVKGAGTDAEAVEAIDAAAQAALNHAELAGGSLMVRRIGAMPQYQSIEGGQVYFYVGSRYRVVTDAE